LNNNYEPEYRGQMRGIILAGGKGSRLFPITKGMSKQLLPVYDKPMIYYPISTLMLAGIREILIIVNPHHLDAFKELLGDGSQWGIELHYAIQQEPKGLPEAFLIGEKFVDGQTSALILGDNLFYGARVGESLAANSRVTGALIYCQEVLDPERYGILELDASNKPRSILEKPSIPPSNLAITGLYFFDSEVAERTKPLVPSSRGELEIVDLLDSYLRDGKLDFELLERGTVWLDTGTFDSMASASEFVRVVGQRQNFRISSPEEVAWRQKYISDSQFLNLGFELKSSEYGQYLLRLANAK
jgi:glucose-1-phosphate thymidylyltransferase